MNQYILVIAVIGAGILLAWQGWAYAIAWGLGCLFHIFFFSLMLVKFNQWQRDKREVDFIGHRLVVFTMLRFISASASRVAGILTPRDLSAYVGGLLTLPAAALGERLVGLIKE